MNESGLEQIINAVLYEGYVLYPYRPSSQKNQRERFTFGRVYPEAYSLAQDGAEPCMMQTECLVVALGSRPRVEVSVRFLQPTAREIGELEKAMPEWNGVVRAFQIVPELRVNEQLFQTWCEAVERRIDVGTIELSRGGERAQVKSFRFPATRNIEPIYSQEKGVVGVIMRRQDAVEGLVEVNVREVSEKLFKIQIRIVNRSVMPESEVKNQEAVLRRTCASTHTILQVEDGEFISLMDVPTEFKEAANECTNVGTYPVLVGDEAKAERTTLLSSPIILYDYPKIAPESAGTLFDGTEIDEILTLRIQTMTDEEKREMRSVDEHARRLLERTENLEQSALQRMHGTLRESQREIEFDDFFGAATQLKEALVSGVSLKAGDRVRVRPKGRADVMDIALAGKTAVIEAVEQDLEKRVHLAVVFEDDPGKELGMARQPGHRFFFGLDEVEPVQQEEAA